MQYCSKCFKTALAAGWSFRWVILVLVVLLLPCLASAQEGTILGTVTDPTGSAVPNATVTILQLSTGTVRTYNTNDAGQYVAAGLPVGKYDVKITAPGFKTEEQHGVVLNVNDRDRVDAQMKVGAKTETISVEANALQVQSDSSEVSSLISGTQITELATNGRTLYSYVQLTTGASSLTPDTQLPVPVGGNGDISFNGNRPTHNLYLLDGGENADRGGSSSNSSVMPSVDAISETQTLSSNYSAEYGLSSGGTISSVVKSGTQAFHASAWEFFRNDALDARYPTNPAPAPVSELRYNIFGFNAGGPVTFGKLYNPDKKKTFFFYNMEWRKIINGGSPITANVPDPTNYTGNFGSTAITVPDASMVSASVLARNCPGGALPAGIVQGAAFPKDGSGNYVIPSCMLDHNVQQIATVSGQKYGAGIFPAPTNSAGQFVLPVSSPTDVREEIVRIDHNFTDKFSVYGHFVAEQINQNYARTMWSGDSVPTIGNTFGNPSYAGVIHTTYTINPTLVNEASFNYNGNRINITPVGLYNSPFTVSGYFDSGATNIPQINLSQLNTQYTVNWMPWTNKADDYQIRDDVSWTKGRQQFRFGGGWALYTKVQTWFKNTQGNYNFNGSFTGNDVADWMLGLANNYTQDAIKLQGHWPNDSYFLYFQDNWRVNNRLTLNLGLRWDGIPHTYETNNNMANFYPDKYDPNKTAVLTSVGGNTVDPSSPGLFTNTSLPGSPVFYTNGIGICGLNGNPRGCVNNAWQNWQPRLGFAYDLRGDGKTVIRGGYGIMNERVQGNDVYNNAGTVPTAASVNFNNVLFNQTTQVLTDPYGGGGTPAVSIPVNNVTGLDKSNYKSPRSTQFSLGIQQSIGKSVLSVAYVGSQNRHQSFYEEINLAPQANLAGYQLGTLTSYNSDVLYPGYHGIRLARNEANAEYNSIQMSIRGQLMKNALTYQVGYTYSRGYDVWTTGSSGGDLGTISNPYAGWKFDWGPSFFDKPNVFFANFVYDLPFFAHSDNKAEKIMLGGWEVSGIVSASSGVPINIAYGGGGVGYTNNVCSVVPNCSIRPDVSGTAHDPHTFNEWFDTSIYTAPAAGQWGNVKANSVRGPGRDNWNMSLFKNFNFSETRGSYLQFRAEFFNIWNHTQFQGGAWNGGVNASASFDNTGTLKTSNNFGKITTTYDPRIIQLALKLYF
ncbi:MAG TPA: carboxypeptidase regulatory-like domain-containing protein [Dongiaceae bacterium]|nr:carboxypeptidase regulatory-like domain-containing protein [Dongiaceae bacterium]